MAAKVKEGELDPNPREQPGGTLDFSPDDESHKRDFAVDYDLGEEVGHGSYGSVHVATHKGDGNTYAVKLIDRKKLKPKDNALVLREISILRDCRDIESIVKLVDFYRSPTHFHVVEYYASGGDLFHRLAARTQYTERHARDLAALLFKAMSSLHKRKIAHRDMKPENILLRDKNDDDTILIADFGFARYVPEEGLKTRCGTPAFVAPEVLVQKPHYDDRVDMWGVGCILYMLIGGYPPFQDRSHQGLFRKIRGADFVFHEAYWKSVSVHAKQLISQLLTVNPEHRISAEDALKSEWFSVHDKILEEIHLGESLREIKKFHAKEHLKGAMHTVLISVKAKMRSMRMLGLSASAKNASAGGGAAPAGTSAGGGNDAESVKGGNLAHSEDYFKDAKKFDEVYELKDLLHEGDVHNLWSCIHKETGEEFSVKIADRLSGASNVGPGGKTSGEAVMHELAVLKSLRHKNIIEIKEMFDEDHKYYLVMESMRGGDLFDRVLKMKKYTEKDARDLAIELLAAVGYMHEQGIAHRDLKPQNILLKTEDDNADVKIADFTFACRVHTPQSLTARCGTPSYVAPEVLKNVPYDQSADMWALGIILYMLLSGCLPFADERQSTLFQKIRTGDWAFTNYFASVSDDAKELISNLLVTNPQQRWTVAQCLNCAWLKADVEHLSSKDLSKSLEDFDNLRKNKGQFFSKPAKPSTP